MGIPPSVWHDLSLGWVGLAVILLLILLRRAARRARLTLLVLFVGLAISFVIDTTQSHTWIEPWASSLNATISTLQVTLAHVSQSLASTFHPTP